MFNRKEISRLEEIAGVKLDLRVFYPLFIIPAFLAAYSPLLALVSLLTVLQLPKLYLLYIIRERKRKLRKELPGVAYSLSWLLSIYPAPEALEKIEGGEIGKIMQKVAERYGKYGDFEKALEELDGFEELEELKEILLHIYRTGRGQELLRKFGSRKAVEYRAYLRERGAKLQLYSTVFVSVAAVFPVLSSSLSIFSGGTPSLLPAYLLSTGVWLLWKAQE